MADEPTIEMQGGQVNMQDHYDTWHRLLTIMKFSIAGVALVLAFLFIFVF